ncbi:MAG: VOC family protein [Chloroflexota bacterium]|nr:VOC family protein [Chloroflexota bacterium]MDE2895496.1 VOC family protein [Chloroflexota bacterium]
MTAAETQRVFPYLAYEDAPAAVDWLCRVFGFEPVDIQKIPDGRIVHAALSLEGAQVMLASLFDGGGYRSPRGLDALPSHILLHVDDVEAHHRQSRSEGANILYGPIDQPWGARLYEATDPEGHRWSFMQPSNHNAD